MKQIKKHNGNYNKAVFWIIEERKKLQEREIICWGKVKKVSEFGCFYGCDGM